MIELELFIVFFTAIFFTLIFMLTGGRSLIWGIFCYAAWQVLALMWVFIVPMSTSYMIAWLFQVISLIFLLATVLGWLDRAGKLPQKLKSKEPSVLD